MRDGEKDDGKREIHGGGNRRVEGSYTRSNVAKTGGDDNAKNRGAMKEEGRRVDDRAKKRGGGTEGERENDGEKDI